MADEPVSLCPFDHLHCVAPDCECECHASLPATDDER